MLKLTIPAAGPHYADLGTPEHVLRYGEEVLRLLEHWGRYRASHNADVHSGIDRCCETTSVPCRDHHGDDRVGLSMQRT